MIAGEHRLMREERAAEVEFAADVSVQAVFEMLGDDLPEDELLAEVLGADTHARFVTAGSEREGKAARSANGPSFFNPAQCAVGGDGEQCGGDRARQNLQLVDRGDAAEDEDAESAGADGGGDGRGADGGDGGDARRPR